MSCHCVGSHVERTAIIEVFGFYSDSFGAHHSFYETCKPHSPVLTRDAPIDRPEIGIGRSSHFMTRSVLVHLADLMYRSQFDDVSACGRT